jgi:hypothetical protein
MMVLREDVARSYLSGKAIATSAIELSLGAARPRFTRRSTGVPLQ